MDNIERAIKNIERVANQDPMTILGYIELLDRSIERYDENIEDERDVEYNKGKKVIATSFKAILMEFYDGG
jgi:hypothetical protein